MGLQRDDEGGAIAEVVVVAVAGAGAPEIQSSPPYFGVWKGGCIRDDGERLVDGEG